MSFMRKKINRVLWLVLLVLIGQPAFSQQPPSEVTGAVLSEKGEYLEGVTVLAENAATHEHYSATTDGKGVFSFKGLAVEGKYNFTFSMIGYEPGNQKNFVVKPEGQKDSLLIRLRERSSELNEVVVTALGVRKEVKK